MITYSEAQVRAFVTDPGTWQRGQQLAQLGKWARLGRSATAAWGECAGSGAKPYLTGVDLTEPAFKCSCPSRVFPCKHGAALLLLLARQTGAFPEGPPPAWLTEWLEKRQQTQGRKAEKAAPLVETVPATAASADPGPAPGAPAAAVDPKRLARMAAGADDLATWLEDLLRAGLATLDQQPTKFWENQAARLVDQQLPGLAASLRELTGLRHAHADWPARLLGRLGELYLLVRAFQNLPGLDSAARLDILQQVGVALKKETLLATIAPVADEWLVLGQFCWEEDRLLARRSWLLGRRTGQRALVLEFAFSGLPFATALQPGACYQGEVVFYPGRLPLRAAPVGLAYLGQLPANSVIAGQRIDQLLDSYATALACQPWLRQWPATLAGVVLVPLPDGGWLLRHPAEAAALPLQFASEDAPWQVLAESGGEPIRLFGEWDGQTLRVLSAEAAQAGPGEEWGVGGAAASVTALAASKPSAAENQASIQAPDSPAPAADVPRGAALLRIALLGTRQSGEAVPPFPVLAASPEQQLLLAAGTLALLRKAGFVPLATTAPLLVPSAPDTRPPLGPAGAACLRSLLEQADLQNMLPDYLGRVAGVGRRVPASLLVPLLHLASRSAAVAAALGPALGQRGRWLAACRPQWRSLLQKHVAPETAADDPSPWETGTLPERLSWLTKRFGQDAAAARALLLAALPTEPAKVQEPLLELLAQHLHADAEPMLENLLRARGLEVRRRAAELLVQLPGAALPERLWARAAPLLSTRRKLLGLGAISLEVALPTSWDKTWLLDGIEEKNFRFMSSDGPDFKTPVGPATARLANLLALLPPGRWAAHLGLPPAELLAAALASEWARPLLPAWAQSTLLHHDTAFAAAFLTLWVEQRPALEKARCDQGIDWRELAALLPASTRQQLVLRPVLDRVRRREADWPREVGFVPAPWPRPLTAAVLEAVAEKLAHTASGDVRDQPAHFRELAWLLPQTVAPRLDPADSTWAIKHVEAIPGVGVMYELALTNFTGWLRFQISLEESLLE